MTLCIFSRSSTSSFTASRHRAKAPAMVRLSRNPSALDAAFLSSLTLLTCACHARSARTVEEFTSICMVRRILSRSAYASRHDVQPKRARRRSGSALTRSKHSFSRRIVSTKPTQPVNAPSFTRFRMRDATREHTSRCLRVSSAKSCHFANAPAAAIRAMRDATLMHKPSSRVCSEAWSCHARRHRVAEPCISLAAMPRSLSRSSDALDAVCPHELNAATSRRLRKRAAMPASSAFCSSAALVLARHPAIAPVSARLRMRAPMRRMISRRRARSWNAERHFT